MRIKFKAPDPRAGTIAQMDSSRGQFFIDNGSAVKVKDDDSDEAPAPAPAPTAEPVSSAALVAAPATKPATRSKK